MWDFLEKSLVKEGEGRKAEWKERKEEGRKEEKKK